MDTHQPLNAPQSSLTHNITEVLDTEVWGTHAVLHTGIENVEFRLVERPSQEPEGARAIRIDEWNKRADAKRDELANVHPSKVYVAEPDPATGQKTVYEVIGDQKFPRMWDGETVSPSGDLACLPDGTYRLDIHAIRYSEWTSCTNPEYGAAFRSEGLPIPYAGVGISVLMETSDGFIPLTRRGIETPVYPGRLYSPGGGPRPKQTSVAAILEEIVEETSLVSGQHFDPARLTVLAYVSDKRHQNSPHERPELVLYLPLTITASEMFDIRDEKLTLKKVPETDVWGYEMVRAERKNLSADITLRGGEYCPPTEAAVAHLLYYKLAQQSPAEALVAAENLMSRRNQYERRPYDPPALRLARSE